MKIGEYQLEKTCSSCPEQYDVFRGGVPVAYFRVRHGHFSVHCPGPLGEPVYYADIVGDGEFDDDERKMHLKKALKAVTHWLNPE